VWKSTSLRLPTSSTYSPSIALSTLYCTDGPGLHKFRQDMEESFANFQGFQERAGFSIHESGSNVNIFDFDNNYMSDQMYSSEFIQSNEEIVIISDDEQLPNNRTRRNNRITSLTQGSHLDRRNVNSSSSTSPYSQFINTTYDDYESREVERRNNSKKSINRPRKK
jgi:hypothetical protein